jgi:prephenate dehydrogenase
MDVGSVKAPVHRLINSRKWMRLSFVGAHPMVGSHERGIEAASGGLYIEGTVILTKDGKTCPESFRAARAFWTKLSKKVVTMDPKLHDALVSEISHVPHAVAVCLVNAASNKALPLAAKGFRDTTRVAASDPSVWLPIFQTNKKEVLAGLDRFERELKCFKKSLRSSNPSALSNHLEKAKRVRQKL